MSGQVLTAPRLFIEAFVKTCSAHGLDENQIAGLLVDLPDTVTGSSRLLRKMAKPGVIAGTDTATTPSIMRQSTSIPLAGEGNDMLASHWSPGSTGPNSMGSAHALTLNSSPDGAVESESATQQAMADNPERHERSPKFPSYPMQPLAPVDSGPMGPPTSAGPAGPPASAGPVGPPAPKPFTPTNNNYAGAGPPVPSFIPPATPPPATPATPMGPPAPTLSTMGWAAHPDINIPSEHLPPEPPVVSEHAAPQSLDPIGHAAYLASAIPTTPSAPSTDAPADSSIDAPELPQAPSAAVTTHPEVTPYGTIQRPDAPVSSTNGDTEYTKQHGLYTPPPPTKPESKKLQQARLDSELMHIGSTPQSHNPDGTPVRSFRPSAYETHLQPPAPSPDHHTDLYHGPLTAQSPAQNAARTVGYHNPYDAPTTPGDPGTPQYQHIENRATQIQHSGAPLNKALDPALDKTAADMSPGWLSRLLSLPA